VLAAVVLYAFICTFPIQFEPLQSGLDGSWMYAINRLATSATDGIGCMRAIFPVVLIWCSPVAVKSFL